MSAGEIIVVFLIWVASICAGYWVGFNAGYEFHKWEDKDDEYL